MIINEHHFFLSFHIGRDKSLRGNHVTVAHQKVHWLHLLVAPEGALCPSQARARSCIDHVTVAQWFTGANILAPKKVHQKVHCLHQAGALVQPGALVHKPEGLMQWQCQCGLQPGGPRSAQPLVLQLDPAQHQAAQATTNEDQAVQEEEMLQQELAKDQGSAGARTCTSWALKVPFGQ